MDRTILIIDDEKRLAESLASLLREEGYNVDVAIGGPAGLERLKLVEYHLVITDLRMPEVDGFQIMDHVSNNLPNTRVIVITGHASTQSAIEAIHQRVADYLTKPFELEYLIAAIEKAFAQIETEELRNDLTRMISHDIKVPLNSIMGFADFIVDKGTGKVSDKAGDYAQKITNNSQKILTLLDNYLTHTRAESGRLKVIPQPFRIEDVIEEATRLQTHEFEAKDIQFQIDAAPLGIVYQGDESLLFRAVSNLLNNAHKYTPEGGTCICRLERTNRADLDDVAVISISNNGPGIEDDELDKVFSKYGRTRSSRGQDGTGIGLYVVDHVSRAHGGVAECESEPNVLTTFRIVLPLDPQRIPDSE